MKISFLVNYDASALLALNYLIPELSDHDLSVFYTRKEPKQKEALKLKAEISTHSLSSLSLFDQSLVENSKAPISFNDSRFQKANKINTDDFCKLESSSPDLIVSIRHMTIMRDAVIALPTHGVINLHSGQLPAYQGVMASFRAMQNEELMLGTCLHFIEDTGIDTGSIIEQSSTPADYERSYLWNVFNIYRSGSANILNAVSNLAKGDVLNPCPQTGESRYYSYPTENDIAQAEFKLFEARDSIDNFLSL